MYYILYIHIITSCAAPVCRVCAAQSGAAGRVGEERAGAGTAGDHQGRAGSPRAGPAGPHRPVSALLLFFFSRFFPPLFFSWVIRKRSLAAIHDPGKIVYGSFLFLFFSASFIRSCVKLFLSFLLVLLYPHTGYQRFPLPKPVEGRHVALDADCMLTVTGIHVLQVLQVFQHCYCSNFHCPRR